MLSYVKEEIQAKERCITTRKSEETREKRFDEYRGKKAEDILGDFTAASLLVQGEGKVDGRRQSTDKDDRKCVYCGNLHTPSKCRIVTNTASRVTILRKKARCFLCLNPSHRAYQCQSKYICARCGHKHHISICKKRDERFQSQENVQTQANTACNIPYILSCTERDEKMESQETNQTHASTSCNILLQTAQAKVGNIVNSNAYFVRILFDSGSQKNYVNRRLVDCLKHV